MQELTKSQFNLLKNIYKLTINIPSSSNDIYPITKYSGENITAIRLSLLHHKYPYLSDHDFNTLIRKKLVSTENHEAWDFPVSLNKENNAVFITPEGYDYLTKENESNNSPKSYLLSSIPGIISGVVVAIIIAFLGLNN